MSHLRQLFCLFILTLLLSACGHGSDVYINVQTEAAPSVVESDPPRIEVLIAQMQPGRSQTLDLSPQITTDSDWQITELSTVDGPVSANLISPTQVSVSADAVGLGEVSYKVESDGETYQGYFAVIVSTWQNNPPTALNIELSSDGTQVVEVDISDFITDPDGDPLSVASLLQSEQRLSLIDGVLSYDPGGSDSDYVAVYILSDGMGGWTAGLILVNLDKNAAPGDSLSAPPLIKDIYVGQTLIVDLNEQVSAEELWELIQAESLSDYIRLEVLEENKIKITALEEGIAQVDYLLRSTDSGSDTSSIVVLAISEVDNQPPYANGVSAETDSETSITMTLEGAYGDPDGDPVSVTSLLQTDDRFSLNGDQVEYSPNGFVGVDSATYLVTDEWGAIAAGLIVVQVSEAVIEPDNNPPVATDLSITTDSDTSLTIDLVSLGLISDPDGDPMTLAVYGGDARVTVNGLILTYSPNGYVGADEFVYQVSDGRGGSALGHIGVTVSDATPANQAPVASATSKSFTLQQIAASPNQTIDLSSVVTDADGDGLAITQIYGALASVSISGALELTYTASASIPEDSFSYVVSDGKGGFAQGTVNVSIDNQAPVAQPITLAIDPYAGGSLSIDLSLYTSDADGDSLILSELGSATAPATISSTGLQLEYTPNGFTGTDSISYSVSDGLATTSSVIQITSSSQAVLTANNVSLGSFPLSLGLLVIDMTPFVSNSSGRSIIFSNVYGANLGTTSFNNSDLLLRYTPDNISYGTDTIFYEVTDGEGNTATATVTLTLSAPAAPVITSLTLDYQGDVTASLTCSGCDHPARTEFHFEVAGVPVSGSGAIYSPTGDDKEKTISVRARVKNQYCNADDSGVNGSNACLITEGQVVIQPKYVADVISGEYSHAALMTDGTVVSWGDAAKGADSSAVQAQLTGVVSIANTDWAYAAIKGDGTVVAWGNSLYGGDASAVQADLTDVTRVFANTVAFAALKSDGSLVTWGSGGSGGNSSGVQAQLTNVVEVFGTDTAFAALKSDGSVVTWGDSSSGGDSSAVAADLINVETISSTRFAFAALKEDGSVVAWGDSVQGGDASSVQASLVNVARVYGNWRAFAAVKDDGSVVTWGNSSFGGDSSSVQADLTGVESISNTTHTFAALKSDNTVVTWGSASIGGDSSSVQAQLTNVESLSATLFAYAALKGDDTVVTWGLATSGGDSSGVQSDLTGVDRIIGTEEAFLALKSDNSVVTWGNSSFGGDSSGVSADFDTVTQIWSNSSSFVAQNQDGTVVTWGDTVEGGDSSAVQSDFTGYSQIFIDLDL
ncbi:Ig-like domain-containing protein [Shewanella submarina]|uniref:Ig-like domain-containing protein n=1 Tax=Shewanella submarina TaxID=2016376 RepID=A0ABV7G6Q8_9GAMM|nr:Ig-like domain-containing protein [Shewanella submarina]MCL1037404.1 Ig-like domain-containing protein [Shewanella submarina]